MLQVYHSFPWERNTFDEPDGLMETDPTLFSPISSNSRRSRIASDGSENVFEPPEFISMLDEEHDQDARRKQAEQKWEARRLKIETEIRRLREANFTHRAAQRHSIASFGDDLEDQLFERRESLPRKRYLSTANQLAEDGSKGLEMEAPTIKEKPPFKRAISLPTNDALFHNIPGMPSLETYEEDEEEEMMGLPPKDIPHLRESMEHMEKIDYESIPPQQLGTLQSSQDSSGSRWSEHEI